MFHSNRGREGANGPGAPRRQGQGARNAKDGFVGNRDLQPHYDRPSLPRGPPTMAKNEFIGSEIIDRSERFVMLQQTKRNNKEKRPEHTPTVNDTLTMVMLVVVVAVDYSCLIAIALIPFLDLETGKCFTYTN